MNKSIIPWRRNRGEIQVRRDENPIGALHREMNDLFDTFFRDFDTPFGAWLPAAAGRSFAGDAMSVDVSETDDEVQVAADLPGLTENDIEVTVDNNQLTIRGEKKDEREESRRNYRLIERSYGRFERSIPLPSGVDRDKVKAKLRNGVLQVTLPKLPEAKSQSRAIEISTD
jgi:HSP20 family protein